MFVAERFISLVAPHHCLSCECEGSLLCEWCLPDAFTPLPPRCYRCLKHSKDNVTCKSCRSKNRPRAVWVCCEYQGLAKQLISALKFSRARSAAELIAAELNEIIPQLNQQTVISHIPTATSRRRQRGYDQSELIAKALAKKRGLEHKTFLRRQGHTRQVGATKKQRREQLAGAFFVSDYLGEHKEVLLIDDLLTTGATIEAATLALKDAGVKKVYTATFAQRSI